MRCRRASERIAAGSRRVWFRWGWRGGCLQDRISSVALTCQPAVDEICVFSMREVICLFSLSLSRSGLAKGTRSAKKNMAFGKRF